MRCTHYLHQSISHRLEPCEFNSFKSWLRNFFAFFFFFFQNRIVSTECAPTFFIASVFLCFSFLLEDCKHVMISYQWDVQKSMIHVRNELQSQGYKVWMDIDEMGGSTLESMARAVENASVVLMGVSQKYKESPNCRSGD